MTSRAFDMSLMSARQTHYILCYGGSCRSRVRFSLVDSVLMWQTPPETIATLLRRNGLVLGPTAIKFTGQIKKATIELK